MAAPRARIVLGSRKSELAMVQTLHVKALLEKRFPGIDVDIRTSATEGDLKLDKPLAELAAASPGLFTKELETWLLCGACDVAVHSLKDVPTQLPPGLAIAAISAREDPRDVVIFSKKQTAAGVSSLSGLPAGALVGTSSLRRQAFIRRGWPELRCDTVRGNLQTRMRKLDEPEAFDGAEGEASAEAPRFDAIVLAAAGVHRLGWAARVGQMLGPDLEVPATMAPSSGPASFAWGVGQGALAVEARSADADVMAMVRAAIEDPCTAAVCSAERAMLRGLLGGCQVPIAVCSSFGKADPEADGATESAAAVAPASSSAPRRLEIRGVVASLDGKKVVERSVVLDLPAVDLAAIQTAGDEAFAARSAVAADADPASSDAVSAEEVMAAASKQPALFVASGCHAYAASDDALRAATEAGQRLADNLVGAGAAALLGDRTAPRPITYGSA